MDFKDKPKEYFTSKGKISPYSKNPRKDIIKENFKAVISELKKIIPDTSKKIKLADLGCANGELLYHIKNEFPNWDLYGCDITDEFIQVGKNFEGLSGVHLETRDMFDVEGEFDVVICMGTIHNFYDISLPLNKFLSLCKKGGFLLADGFFNKRDIELRIKLMDNTSEETKGHWKTSFNKHSRKAIINAYKDKVSEIRFEDIIMNVYLPKDPNKPAVIHYTFKDAEGKNIVTNDFGIIFDNSLLIMKK